MLTPFRVSTCMFKNSIPRVLQKVLLQLPTSVFTAPYWCIDNTWNAFLHPYSVIATLLGYNVNTVTVLTHIEGVASKCYSYPATMLAGVCVWMLITIIKLKNIAVGTTKFCLCMVTFTNKRSALLANQFIEICKTHAQ